jgi:hypothetical protein
MLELLGFAILSGLAGASAKQIKQSLKPGRGNAKKPKPKSDFQRRKAEAKKGGKRR